MAEEKRRAERQATEASYVPILQEEEELGIHNLEDQSLGAAQNKGWNHRTGGYQ